MTSKSKVLLLVAAFVTPVAFLTNVFWGGYVLSVLWGWFVSPLGVQSISALHAAGLQCLFLSFLGSRGTKDTYGKYSFEILSAALVNPIIGPAFGLLVGWIIKSWM